jgi:hypothetical protein
MNQSEALIAAINGEAAAVYAYGLLGPQLDISTQSLARSSMNAHRQRELSLRAKLEVVGGAQPGAAVAYELPFPVTDATSARELAGVVEMRLSATYADLAGATTGSARNDAVLGARECAVRGITWGASTAAFPGLD